MFIASADNTVWRADVGSCYEATRSGQTGRVSFENSRPLDPEAAFPGDPQRARWRKMD